MIPESYDGLYESQDTYHKSIPVTRTLMLPYFLTRSKETCCLFRLNGILFCGLVASDKNLVDMFPCQESLLAELPNELPTMTVSNLPHSIQQI